MFLGQFKTTTLCTECQKETSIFEQFLDVSLPIYGKSLEDCFNFFTQSEKLRGENQVYCSTCSKHQIAFRTTKIFKLPEILVIQLKRFDAFSKIHNPVPFPKDLDVSKYIDKESRIENTKYTLSSVIYHMGELNFGHYMTSCLYNEQRYLFNDHTITKEKHSRTTPYILIYKMNE